MSSSQVRRMMIDDVTVRDFSALKMGKSQRTMFVYPAKRKSTEDEVEDSRSNEGEDEGEGDDKDDEQKQQPISVSVSDVENEDDGKSTIKQLVTSQVSVACKGQYTYSGGAFDVLKLMFCLNTKGCITVLVTERKTFLRRPSGVLQLYIFFCTGWWRQS